jgi:hypothetical protein
LASYRIYFGMPWQILTNSKNKFEFGSNSIVEFSFILFFVLSKLQLQTTIKPWKDKKWRIKYKYEFFVTLQLYWQKENFHETKIVKTSKLPLSPKNQKFQNFSWKISLHDVMMGPLSLKEIDVIHQLCKATKNNPIEAMPTNKLVCTSKLDLLIS